MPQVLAMFVAGAGMVKALYNGLNWLAANKDQLGEVFTRIAESLPALNTAYVPGSTDPNAFQNRVLAAMKSAAPLFLSFLASQFGLGKLPTALKKAIGYVPKKIENALRKGLQSFAKKANGGTAVKEKNSSLTTNKGPGGAATDEFTYGGKVYRLVVAAESKGGTTIKIIEKETNKLVGKPLKEADFTTAEAKAKFAALLTAADSLRNKAKKPVAGQAKPTFAVLKAAQGDLNSKRGDFLHEAYIGKCVYLGSGCFAAGTRLWTPQGYRSIEDIRAGERVYSRDQWDEAGEIVGKIVEEVFERYAGVTVVRAGGRDIRTTHEHPFFVRGKGWTMAHELRIGDRIVCADRTTVAVEAVTDTGEWELVYNLRVSEYHTYFVGAEGWGWAAWAHNAYYTPVPVSTGPHANRWILEDRTATPTRGLKLLDTAGGLRTFESRNAAVQALTQLRAVGRETYVPTEASTDTPLRRAADAIHATCAPATGQPSRILGTEVNYYYAAGQPLAGQAITDIDIWLETALVEAKSDGVSLLVLQEKYESMMRLFDPTVCASPLALRPIIFYCENMERQRLRNFQLRFEELGLINALIVRSLPDLIALVS